MSSSKKDNFVRWGRPIQHPLTASWNIFVPGPDFAKMLKGFKPTDMDDKWACTTEGPDEQGNVTIKLLRSWTGYQHVVLQAKVNPSKNGGVGDVKRDGGRITGIIWERGEQRWDRVDEAQAKTMAKNFCKGLLGVELKTQR